LPFIGEQEVAEASLESRIEQFRKMAHDDPNNELGHFSLGRACLDAGRDADAIESLERALSINPNLSKAYQLLATALLRQGDRGRAIERLTQGVIKADERGDVLPRTEMTRTLTELGAPVPELKSRSAAAQPVGQGQVLCKRCGRVATRLAKPPFRNAFGQEIFEHTCTDCWREAIGQGTKVINELRLPMSDPQAQKQWDIHIREFLNLQQ
jgi:Fe-S cluster biosynthesis and repair protein YggX